MTKTLSMVSHKNYNLSANEGFVIFLTSKLITCFIDDFTLKMKSRSIAYVLNGSEDIYWILDIEGEVHSTWDLWTNGLQKCKDNGFLEVGRANITFWSGLGIWIFWTGSCPCLNLPPLKRLWGGGEVQRPPSGKNRPLVAYELVEFEK